MADVTISYKGAEIASMSVSGSKVLQTQGKYCEGDITVSYTAPGGSSTDPTYKRWVFNNPTRISADQTVELLQDAWLLQNRESDALEVTVRAMDPPDGTASEIYWVQTMARNISLTTGKSHNQIITRAGNNTSYSTSNGGTLSGVLPNTRGQLKLDANGKLLVKIDNAAIMEAGDYEIIARLMPT